MGGGEDNGDELKAGTGCWRFDCAKELILKVGVVWRNKLGGDDKGDELE